MDVPQSKDLKTQESAKEMDLKGFLSTFARPILT
jgi:hypothetical protein